MFIISIIHLDQPTYSYRYSKIAKFLRSLLLTLLDNIPLQVVGGLIIQNSKPFLSVTALFVLDMEREAIQSRAYVANAYPQKSFSS